MTDIDLLELRRRLGLSQTGMAAALGMSLKGYQELERGTRFDTGAPVVLDKRTALACSALAFGLDPWPTRQRTARRIRFDRR